MALYRGKPIMSEEACCKYTVREHSSWSENYYEKDYPNATEQQQRLMAPASIGGRTETF